jgi:hypothetical protein
VPVSVSFLSLDGLSCLKEFLNVKTFEEGINISISVSHGITS